MTKTSLLIAAAALLPFTASAASLELTITNVEADTGAIMIGVYNSADAWSADESVSGGSYDAEAGSVTIRIDDLEPGDVAIKLYHDVDGDGDLARGNFGIPVEPYGFSNDAPVRFGPPSWKAAKFTLTEGETSHTIKLR